MTERKPRGMSFTSWIDQQIADAEKRGVFDDLPGAGKPLDLKRDGGPDYGQAWMRDYARREGVSPEEFLPTPLRLRREVERLTDSVADMSSEDEVREVTGELNRRILEWRRIPVDGPPIFVPLVSKAEMVDRWRAARAAEAVRAASHPQPSAQVPPASNSGMPPPARVSRWRRMRHGRSRQ
jgi:hypothetical protein